MSMVLVALYKRKTDTKKTTSIIESVIDDQNCSETNVTGSLLSPITAQQAM
jgi:hypothetical protein